MKEKIDYVSLIFGDMLTLKRHLVKVLKSERISNGLSPDEMDTVLLFFKLGLPQIEAVEEDPSLFSCKLYQAINAAALETKFKFCLDSAVVNQAITAFVSIPKNLERALADFHDKVISVHITDYGTNPDEYLQKALHNIECMKNGQPEKTVSMPVMHKNSIPATEMVSLFISLEIIHSL